MSVPSEQEYEAFVDDVICRLKYNLSADGDAKGELPAGSKRQKINASLQKIKAAVNKGPAGMNVLLGRYALGADDALYLQSGLAALWSSAESAKCGAKNDSLALAPAGLYAPDAVDGIRTGLIKALQRQNHKTRENAKDTVTKVATAFSELLNVKGVKEAFGKDLDALKEACDALKSGSKTPSPKHMTDFKNGLDAVRRMLEEGGQVQGLAAKIQGAIAHNVKELREQKQQLLERLQTQKYQAASDLADAKSNCLESIRKLNREYNEKEAELNAAHASLAEALRTELEENKTTLSECQRRMRFREGELSSARSNLQAARERRDTLDAEVTQLSTDLEQCRESLKAAQSQLSTANENLRDADARAGRIPDLERQSKNLGDRCARVEADLSEKQRALASTLKELDECQVAQSRLKATLTTETEEKEALVRVVSRLEQDHTQKLSALEANDEQKRADLKKTFEEKERELIAGHNQVLQRHAAQRAAAIEKLESAHREWKQVQTERWEAKSEKDKATFEYELEKCQEELRECKEQLRTRTREIEECEMQLGRSRAARSVQDEEFNTLLRETKERCQEDALAQQKRINELEETLQVLRGSDRRAKRLVVHVNALRKKVALQQAMIAGLKDTAQSLTDNDLLALRKKTDEQRHRLQAVALCSASNVARKLKELLETEEELEKKRREYLEEAEAITARMNELKAQGFDPERDNLINLESDKRVRLELQILLITDRAHTVRDEIRTLSRCSVEMATNTVQDQDARLDEAAGMLQEIIDDIVVTQQQLETRCASYLLGLAKKQKERLLDPLKDLLFTLSQEELNWIRDMAADLYDLATYRIDLEDNSPGVIVEQVPYTDFVEQTVGIDTRIMDTTIIENYHIQHPQQSEADKAGMDEAFGVFRQLASQFGILLDFETLILKQPVRLPDQQGEPATLVFPIGSLRVDDVVLTYLPRLLRFLNKMEACVQVCARVEKVGDVMQLNVTSIVIDLPMRQTNALRAESILMQNKDVFTPILNLFQEQQDVLRLNLSPLSVSSQPRTIPNTLMRSIAYLSNPEDVRPRVVHHDATYKVHPVNRSTGIVGTVTRLGRKALVLSFQVAGAAVITAAGISTRLLTIEDEPEASTTTYNAIIPMGITPNDRGTASSLSNDSHLSDHVVKAYAIARGLVGQRSPIEAAPADAATAHPNDQRLAFALPDPYTIASALPAIEHIAKEHPLTTEDHAKMQQTTASTSVSMATVESAFRRLNGDFAMTSHAKTDEALSIDSNGGEDEVHEVRWMPTGTHGATMARCAVMEHASARCLHVAAQSTTPSSEAAALRQVAAVLKLKQLPHMYRMSEALTYEEEDAPTTGVEVTEGKTLVTRPCARVQGCLSFPVDAGVAAVDEDHKPAIVADLAVAGERKKESNAMRNSIRKTGVQPVIHIASKPHDLAFRPKPASSTGVSADMMNSVLGVSPTELKVQTWLTMAQHGLRAAQALDCEEKAVGDLIDSALDKNNHLNPSDKTTASDRRDALWTEFQRNLAIAPDRLWVFVRTLSGVMGDDVTSIITQADAEMQRATKALAEQRLVITKRVSDMQSKVVEQALGGLMKDTKLVLNADSFAKEFVVIDSEAKRSMRELASGESGRPYFEANVALRNMSKQDQPTRLVDLLSSLGDVGLKLQDSLEANLIDTQMAGASLTELSHPSNSYFVHFKADVIAAIRTTHDMLNVELATKGGSRPVSLWELVEGGCADLSSRFAQMVAYVLVQARASTGVSAMYIGSHRIQANAHQARVGLQRLVHMCLTYTNRIGHAPNYEDMDNGRSQHIERASAIDSNTMVEGMRVPFAPKLLSWHQHASGWGHVGRPGW